MQVRIQVVVVGEDGGETVLEVVTIERAALSPETLGLSLAEGKAILSGIQRRHRPLRRHAAAQSAAGCASARARIGCGFGRSSAR